VISVGPSWSHSSTWWASHQEAGRSQPGKMHPPSRTIRARRWWRLAYEGATHAEWVAGACGFEGADEARGDDEPEDLWRKVVAVVIGELTDLVAGVVEVHDDNNFGFGEFAGCVGHACAAVQQFGKCFGCGL
jgi:hypothetical protein